MSYIWLLFDSDDTLFDYSLAETKALRSTFENFGQMYRFQYLQIYQLFNRQVWEEFERGETSALELRLKRFRFLFDEICISPHPSSATALLPTSWAGLTMALTPAGSTPPEKPPHCR